MDSRLENLLGKADNNTLTIGEVVAVAEEIENLSNSWMDFQDNSKIETFIETVGKDPKFSKLVVYITQNYTNKSVTVGVESEIRGLVEGFGNKDKFLSMLYVGMKCGISFIKSREIQTSNFRMPAQEEELVKNTSIRACLEDLERTYHADGLDYSKFSQVVEKYQDGLGENKLYFYKDRNSDPDYFRITVWVGSKESEPFFVKNFFGTKESRCVPYIIGNWHQEKYMAIVNMFALENSLTNWDGETAVNDPLTNDWELDWVNLVQNYLSGTGTGLELNKYQNIVAKTTSLLIIDSELVQLAKKIGKGQEEIKRHLNIKNLYTEYGDAKNVAEIIKNSTFRKEDLFVEVVNNSTTEGDTPLETPLNPDYLRTPKDALLWSLAHNRQVLNRKAVKQKSSVIKIAREGKIIAKILLDPWFIYEDFEGGQTYHYPENKIETVLDIKINNGTITIEYLDENKKERKIKI